MSIKRTNLLSDEPSATDEFGPHNRIATLIQNEIMDATEGRSIAVIGEWGSGKSTVIRILESYLAQSGRNPSKAEVFLYDAWSHQGDALRRAFLDDLVEFSRTKHLIEAKEIQDFKDLIWNRTEETKTVSEPLLQKHAKWLLFTLALVPIGLRIFDIPEAQRAHFWSQILLLPNLIAISLMVAPILSAIFFSILNLSSCTRLKNFFFGTGNKDSSFSVFSFFVQKTRGTVERKHIKTPSDSIIEFKAVFVNILNEIGRKHPDTRLVVIVDNLDRIPASQARDFWATMQTFFSHDGGLKRPASKKYWLVVPFTIEALSFIFKENSENPRADLTDLVAKANSYIDKTFGITFNVPPPILSNWRKYLLGQLEQAFPENDRSELVTVRDLYGQVSSSPSLSITPRRMKLFVNGLVILYRQRGDEVPLPVISAYLIHRAKIEEANKVPDGLLSPTEIRILDSMEWPNQLAALHFGVSPSEAAQLLLQEPIFSALYNGISTDLSRIEDHPGFYDVLQQTVRDILNEGNKDPAAMLCRIAAAVGSLIGADNVNLHGVWVDIRKSLRGVKGWDNFQVSPQNGIFQILRHTSSDDQIQTRRALAQSLSDASIDFPESVAIWPNQSLDIVQKAKENERQSALNWLMAATSLFDGLPVSEALEISIPGSQRFKLAVCQILADTETSDAIKLAIAGNLNIEEFSKALVTEISNGQYSGQPANLISLLNEILKLNFPWDQVVQAGTQRFNAVESQRWNILDYDASEFRALLELLICIETSSLSSGAAQLLTQLSVAGQLSNILFRLNERREVTVAVLSAIIIYNPAFQRTGEFEQSPSGDAVFNSLASASVHDQNLIHQIANFMSLAKLKTKLLLVTIQNSKIARLGAAVLGVIATSVEKFNVEPRFLIENREFFRTYGDLVSLESVVENSDALDTVFELLSNEPFDMAKCYLYMSMLNLASKNSNSTFLNFLEVSIQRLSKSDWQNVLNSNTVQYTDLLALSQTLRTVNTHFELSTNVRDAIRELVSSGGSGKTSLVSQTLSRLSQLYELLPPNLRRSLARDVIDDMAASSDQQVPRRTIDWFGDNLLGEDLTDPDKTIRRIFTRLIEQPDEKGITWILCVIAENCDLVSSVPQDLLSEFETRLRQSITNDTSLPAPIREGLEKLAAIYSFDLAKKDEDIPGSEAR